MTKQADSNDTERRSYEHLLATLQSASEILIECCHEIEDAELSAAENVREINQLLGWLHGVRAQIYSAHPDLRPAKEPHLRRWPKDPDKPADSQRLSRGDALRRLRHHLELVQLIVQESWPFAEKAGLDTGELEDRFARIGDVYNAVLQEIWEDLSDQQRRSWVRDWGKPEGVPESPLVDQGATLERLDQKLRTATKLLDDCAELAVESEIEPRSTVRTIGYCMAAIFEIQNQVYEIRPDMTPRFLKNRESKK